MNVFKPERRSVRLDGYDYSSPGAYFITVCAERHRPFFGEIQDGQMTLNWVGRIVEREWCHVAEIRPEVVLDEYVIMPNHFHAIVMIRRDMACHVRTSAPDTNSDVTPPSGMASHAPTFGKPQSNSIGAIIGGFKSAVTRSVNKSRTSRGQASVVVWQRSFYDRIIRDEKELHDTRRYITENPLHWHLDDLYPA